MVVRMVKFEPVIVMLGRSRFGAGLRRGMYMDVFKFSLFT